MAAAGATIVDPVDTGDTFAWFDAEFTVLLYEFKGDIAAYLSRDSASDGLRPHAHAGRPHRLQRSDTARRRWSSSARRSSRSRVASGEPDRSGIRRRPELCLELTRTDGIDRVMAEHDLDAVLSPSYAFGSSAPAAPGIRSCRCRLAWLPTASRRACGCMLGSSRSRS